MKDAEDKKQQNPGEDAGEEKKPKKRPFVPPTAVTVPLEWDVGWTGCPFDLYGCVSPGAEKKRSS